MAKRTRQDQEMESAMGGAGDATSGGGAGRGIPDADTVMRLGRDIGVGDVEADKAKLFPELSQRKHGKKAKSGKTSMRRAQASSRPDTSGAAGRKGVGQGRGSAGRPHGRLEGKTGRGATTGRKTGRSAAGRARGRARATAKRGR